MASWNIIFERGATYQATLHMSGVQDINQATLWRLTCSQPNAAAFLVATTANGMFVATQHADQKTLVIPAATTATMPLGNARYDFEIEWAGGVVRRYISNGLVQVNPKVGV
jgi:hypothetical protein